MEALLGEADDPDRRLRVLEVRVQPGEARDPAVPGDAVRAQVPHHGQHGAVGRGGRALQQVMRPPERREHLKSVSFPGFLPNFLPLIRGFRGETKRVWFFLGGHRRCSFFFKN